MEGTFSAELHNIQNALNILVAAAVTFRCILILINGKNDSQPIEGMLSKCKKIVLAGIIILTLRDMVQILQIHYFVQTPTNAGIKESAIFSGGLQLLEAVIKMFIALNIVWTSVDLIKGLLLYIKSADGVKQEALARMEKSIVAGVLILAGLGLVTVILQYFQPILIS